MMWTAIDATGVRSAPVRDANPSIALFFIVWVILGSVLLLNLFVGILVNIFEQVTRQEDPPNPEPDLDPDPQP